MQKLIGFVTGGLDFNGNSLNEKALGGSESAMIYMARELAALGNIVFVYCNCVRPGIYDGVIYSKIEDFRDIKSKHFDVLIVSRNVEVVPPQLISNLTIFWMHDTYTPAFTGTIHLTDKVFLLSEYHKSIWVNENKHFGEMIHVTSNGFDAQLAKSRTILPFSEKKNSYIYASRPERGLKFLLTDIWPEIIKHNPEAYLHICGYENPFEMPDETKILYEEIDELIKSSTRVVQLGPLDKSKYYGALGQCAYMLYPCDYPEISCINAIEAQAMGCLVISSDAFALSETVKTPTLVKGTTTEEYKTNFVDKVIEYQNEAKYMAATTWARDLMYDKYTWTNVAKSWDTYIDNMFEERFEKYKPQVFKRLGYNSDYITWSKIDPNFDQSIIPAIKKMNFNYEYFVSMAEPPPNALEVLDEVPPNVRQVQMLKMLGEHLAKNPEKKFTVLELGCYDGPLSGNFYKQYSEQIDKVIAYDGFQTALDAYKKIWEKNPQCKNIEYICDNITNLPSHNLKADIIIAGEILEHFEDYKTMLEDVQRCANPGAMVLYSVPKGPWAGLTKKFNERPYHSESHLHHFEMLDLITMFKDHQDKNGFFICTTPGIINNRNERCDNWVFGYYNNEEQPFHEYDWEIKVKKLRPYFSISTCMIVKNEENDLFRCLNSVKNISDEIIIVDTGSMDQSKAICKSFTDKVYDLKWEEEDGIGSFERARNYSLDKASGDYIFYIDADEELIEGARLADYIRSEYVLNFDVLQKQIMLEGGDKQDQFPNRLFRRGALRFYGVIHELPKQKSGEPNDMLGIVIPSPTKLHHFGYLDHRIRLSKLDRNKQLLAKNIKKYPDLLDNWFYQIRDQVFYYQYFGKKDYLENAITLWENYPIIEHKGQIDFWMASFKLMQFVLEQLEKDEFVMIRKKIGKEKLRFLGKRDYSEFKKIRKMQK